jgi:hypothetical protein
MKQFIKDIQTRLQDFWIDFRPSIIDFIVICALGFMIYWTRWRKKPLEKTPPRNATSGHRQHGPNGRFL